MRDDGAAAPKLPVFEDLRAAERRLDGVVARTPLLSSPTLDRATGARVLIKAECLQRTGSFKLRGAYNRLAALPEAERARGVVAFSSGNHAQGVAEAARLFGVPAAIVMPADAPKSKAAGVTARGARIVTHDRDTEDREAIAAKIAAETGAHLTPSYDHPDVIAGQGTTGLEIAEDAPEPFDALVCPVSGGGLMAGIGLAFETLSPATRLYTAEPAGFDDTRRSLLAGAVRANVSMSGSICDALMARRPGALTFPINKRLLSGGVAVSDAEALAAMAFAFRHLKLVLEPGGAAALAAVLLGKLDFRGARVCVVATGGNVDAGLFARALHLQ